MGVFCKHGMFKTKCSICSPKAKTEITVPRVFVKDRNLAFKCNWLDTDYEGPCGKGRQEIEYTREEVSVVHTAGKSLLSV